MWQNVFQRHRDRGFDVLSVAVDVQGADAARVWPERAGATFRTLVDSENVLGMVWGFRVVPNGIFVDESGAVRMKVFGGVGSRPEITRAVEDLIAGRIDRYEEPPAGAEPVSAAAAGGDLLGTRLRRGAALLREGRKEAAVEEWKKALAADPENFTIRKQIWAVRFPEKFHPAIDFDWQKEQLAREREEAAAFRASGCGPDDCPIPSQS